MPIYERPTKSLLCDFVRERVAEGQVFHKAEAVAWFAERYPRIKSTTVKLHIEGMAINNGTQRKHHLNIRPGSGHDLFFKLGSDQFRLWDPKSDPAPVYGSDTPTRETVAGPETEEIDDFVEERDALPGSTEFAFERDLQNYLVKNLHLIEPGLRLYEEEGFSGVGYPTGRRFIDILALDRENRFVVIELKVGRGHERVIGQILGYIGWVQKNLADGQPVRGFVVASNISEDLRLAASQTPHVKLVEYEIAFSIRPIQ